MPTISERAQSDHTEDEEEVFPVHVVFEEGQVELRGALPTSMSIPEAGRLFGLGRSKAYLEANRYLETDGREGLPAVRFGGSLRSPTVRVLERLGFGHG